MGSQFHPSGDESIDILKGLQLTLNQAERLDVVEKIERIKLSVGFLGLKKALGRQYIVSAGQIFGVHPDEDTNTLVAFQEGLYFAGELEGFNYIEDSDIPLDSLVTSFSEPEVLGVDTREAEAFRKLRLVVPILAIETCAAL